MSYSLYHGELEPWFRENAPAGWNERRQQIVDLLQKDTELQEIVQLVGPDALQDHERLVLEFGRMIKEVFLQQNAFSEDDAYSSLEKTGGIMDALMEFYEECEAALNKGVSLNTLMTMPERERVARLRELNPAGFTAKKEEVVEAMKRAVHQLIESEAA